MAKDYILKNRLSEYLVLIPEKYSEYEKLAGKELVRFFREATDVELKIVTKKNSDDSKNYFSIGKTKLFYENNVKLGDTGVRGYQIKTVNKNVFINGKTRIGSLYGVYALLKELFGYEQYAPDCYYIDKNVNEVLLPDFNIIDKPKITYNIIGNGIYEGINAVRMKFEDPNWLLINGGKEYHNSFNYISPDIYKNSHPEWFSDDGTQLCFLAHGNERSKEEMYQLALKTLKEHLIANRDSNRVSFTQQDQTTWCDCENCKKLKEKYKTDCVSMLLFVNRLGKDIKKWFDTDGRDYARDFDIVFFAYHATRFPPVKKIDNVYVPLDESFVLEDNVCVYYAPIGANYNYPLDHEINGEVADSILGWQAISKKLYIWIYSTNFHYYLAPYDSFSSMQNTYKFLTKMNTYLLFDENQYNATNATGFTVLKGYLSSKYAWNCDEDENTLIKNFFSVYFGNACEIMYDCFCKLLDNFRKKEKNKKFDGSVYQPVLKKELFPKKFLSGCISDIRRAIESIDYLRRDNSKEYKKIKNRIILESISFRYLLIEIYGKSYSEKRLSSMKRKFKSDCKKVNITRKQEGVLIEELFKEWGV